MTNALPIDITYIASKMPKKSKDNYTKKKLSLSKKAKLILQ